MADATETRRSPTPKISEDSTADPGPAPDPGKPAVREEFLPYAVPTIGEEEIAEVVDSLRSGWITTGPKVKRFEAATAEAVGASNAVAVSSCTAGLHLSLRAMEIGQGDEVIVPTMTFCSTANVVEHVGARPVMVDVGRDGNIDLDAAARAVTPATKAIIPVHYGGQAVDLDELYTLASSHGLKVIEDAAHAIGSTYRDQPVGADSLTERWPELQRATVFSFYATKNMTTGEGGMVTTPDEALADEIRLLSLHGMSKDAWQRYSDVGSWYYEVTDAGFKANMTDIQAALGIHQLARLPDFNATRQRLARMYDDALGSHPLLHIPIRRPERNHVYHLYVIRVTGEAPLDRAELIDALRANNIGTSVHFIPIHLHPHYRDRYGLTEDDFPVATDLYRGSVSLPLNPSMSATDVTYVEQVVRRLLQQEARSGGGETIRGNVS